MKKLGHSSYTNLFISQVQSFLEQVLSRQERQSHHLLAVSGGVDSMALLWVTKILADKKLIGPFSVVFCHHQTRTGQDQEASLVKTFCQEFEIPFKSVALNGLNKNQPNFEAEARRLRKEALLKEKADFIWEAHHLNDSYEWHLMQKSKSRYLNSSLGIPVRNKKIIRPFMCVSKVHIERLARIEKIPHLFDPTNIDPKFERNYVRLKIIPRIEARYPKYLASYVAQMNALASILKLNILPAIVEKKIVYKEAHLFLGDDFSKSSLASSIHHFSTKDRGEIFSTVEKMLKAIKHQKHGPFHFSGGVRGFYSPGILMIAHHSFANKDEELFQRLSQLTQQKIELLPKKTLQELKKSFEDLLNRSDAPVFFPMPCLVIENKFVEKTLNTSGSDSLFPRVTELCRSKGWRLVAMNKLLATWESKQKRLPQRLGIYPLHELYHLFSSQE